jgi:hypothetical protein
MAKITRRGRGAKGQEEKGNWLFDMNDMDLKIQQLRDWL